VQATGDEYTEKAERIAAWLSAIDDPLVLRDLYCPCARRGEAVWKKLGRENFGVDVYFEGCTGILWCLAEMGTTESAGALVDLLEDERLCFDGEGALTLVEALIKCGPPCVERLSSSPVDGANRELAELALAGIVSEEARPSKDGNVANE